MEDKRMFIIFEGKVKKAGNASHVILQKKFIGKKVIVLAEDEDILNEYDEFKELKKGSHKTDYKK